MPDQGPRIHQGAVLVQQVPAGYKDPHEWSLAHSDPFPDGRITVIPGPAGGDDAILINNAISNVGPGGIVQLQSGALYTIKTPVIMGQGVTLNCDGLTGVSSKGTGSDKGSAVLVVSASFNPGALQAPAVIAFIGSDEVGSTTNSNEGGVRGVWIDGAASPAGTDGISIYGNYGSGTLSRLVIVNMAQNGISSFKGAVGNHLPDGWTWENIICQASGNFGILETVNDLFAVNVHSQNSHADNWRIINGAHNVHVGCRGDVSAIGSGFYLDLQIGTNPNDSFEFIGGGTQLNNQYGFFVNNTRSAGKSNPVIISGVTCDGDNVAGLRVAGPNAVRFDGNILITSALPPVAFVTDFDPTLGTQPPDMLRIEGGIMGGATGPFTDNAGIENNQLAISSMVVRTNGSGLTSFNRRYGQTTLAAGTATVANPWVTANTRITVTRTTAGGTQGFLSVVPGAGTFTITSSSNLDTSVVQYQFQE
jgi:hypothetical protein